ncbi:M16 family metallopeptidase [Roseateles oligotrophus]|uniref:Insulinase family protein n=1 Tax=Roseateles oligotrophus TaxID=1769250 RepID=A0ABT2YM87_9BURK|nr:pitrilysin family protein [Roseateles oligotrophus]MCV2371173.1 insulinase family protein [Roseateles oligotrophus]
MKPNLNKTILAALLALPLGAIAADAIKMPAELPKYGQDKPIQVPQISKKLLANGLEVWVLPRQGLPRVDYVLALRGAGFGADGAQAPGQAKLLAGLLNEGTAQRDSRAIAEAAQGMGGGVAAAPANDGITLTAYALTSHAEGMMKLLAEVARSPSFPEGEVALAKANALQALKVASAQPGFRASKALNQAIYGEHPYGHSQETAESIEATTAEILRAEHVKRFRPDRALLVIAGRIDAAEAMKLAQAAFGDWKAQGPAPAEIAAAPLSAKPQHILLERPDSVQSTVRLGRPGAPASGADQVPLRLTSTILGSGFSSRINQNLREEKGYTYGANAGARSYRVGGAITGGADVRNEVTGASLQEFVNEYRRIGTELVPAEELAMNKRYVAGSYLLTTQLQGAVAQTLANNWLVGLPAEYLGQYVPLIQKVTAEQVRAIGKTYFSPETQSLVVVGDKAVAEQLKAFGEFKSSGGK